MIGTKSSLITNATRNESRTTDRLGFWFLRCFYLTGTWCHFAPVYEGGWIRRRWSACLLRNAGQHNTQVQFTTTSATTISSIDCDKDYYRYFHSRIRVIHHVISNSNISSNIASIIIVIPHQRRMHVDYHHIIGTVGDCRFHRWDDPSLWSNGYVRSRSGILFDIILIDIYIIISIIIIIIIIIIKIIITIIHRWWARIRHCGRGTSTRSSSHTHGGNHQNHHHQEKVRHIHGSQ